MDTVKMVKSWGENLSAKDMTIAGYGLLWFNDKDPGTRHQIGRDQYEGLAKDVEISYYRDDVRSYYNHDSNYSLGRMKNGTLSLRRDDKGLWFETKLNPKSAKHVDLYADMERGDVEDASATFFVESYRWEEHSFGDIVLYDKIILSEIGPVNVGAMSSSMSRIAASNEVSEYALKLAETHRRLKMKY